MLKIILSNLCAWEGNYNGVTYVCGNLSMGHTCTFLQHPEGSVAKWSVRQFRKPVDPGSSPALATCWICSESSRVQILSQTCK